MSNEPTISEMNEAIALFMGYERYEDKYGIWFKTEGLITCLHRKLQDLNYHTSWDALMPCWDRFRAVVSDHFDEDYPAEYCSMCDVWALHCEHVSINGAHKLLHDAIQWYNQQKQKDEVST